MVFPLKILFFFERKQKQQAITGFVTSETQSPDRKNTQPCMKRTLHISKTLLPTVTPCTIILTCSSNFPM